MGERGDDRCGEGGEDSVSEERRSAKLKYVMSWRDWWKREER